MTQDAKTLESLAREYRPSMDAEVLHSWGADVVAALSALRDGEATKGADSAAPYDYAMKRVYENLAKEGGGTWATYMMMDIDEAIRAALTRNAEPPVGAAVTIQMIDAALDAAGRPHTYENTERMKEALLSSTTPPTPTAKPMSELDARNAAHTKAIFDLTFPNADAPPAPTAAVDGEVVGVREAALNEAMTAAYSSPHYLGSEGMTPDAGGLLQPGSPYDRGRYDARKARAALKASAPEAVAPTGTVGSDLVERLREYAKDWRTRAADNGPVNEAIAVLSAASAESVSNHLHTEGEWHEDYGDVVWWCWRDGKWLGEPAYIGSPLATNWPGYHTHWTPHPAFPSDFSAPTGEGEAL